jgi:ZIP family zinc transporter
MKSQPPSESPAVAVDGRQAAAARSWQAAAIATALLLLLLGGGIEAWRWLAPRDAGVAGALLGGSMAFAATALGTLPVLLSQQFSQRANDTMLGFGAGVMLAASAFSLVLPALEAAGAQGAGPWGAGLTVAAGVLAGALLLLAIDRAVPHEHFVKGAEGPQAVALKRTWLFVFAIALHNLPEGLAIGVAFAGSDVVGAQALATGISIQDVPEGLVVALALRCIGYGRWVSAGLGAASGVVEPLAAVAGAALIGLSASLLPWGLAMAAGAMLFVISHEVIPESHRRGHESWATGGLMFGFVLMMLLDTALG